MRLHLLALAAVLGCALTASTAHASVAHLTLEAPTLTLHHARPSLLGETLGHDELNLLPADDGGGAGANVDPGTKRVLAFVLGFLPGFGIGHIVAGDKNGFILFLIVDIAVTTGAILLTALTPEPIGAIVWIAWVGEHVFEGYEAYRSAGGEKMVQRAADSLMIARDDLTPAAPRLLPASRAVSFAF